MDGPYTLLCFTSLDFVGFWQAGATVSELSWQCELGTNVSRLSVTLKKTLKHDVSQRSGVYKGPQMEL